MWAQLLKRHSWCLCQSALANGAPSGASSWVSLFSGTSPFGGLFCGPLLCAPWAPQLLSLPNTPCPTRSFCSNYHNLSPLNEEPKRGQRLQTAQRWLIQAGTLPLEVSPLMLLLSNGRLRAMGCPANTCSLASPAFRQDK